MNKGFRLDKIKEGDETQDLVLHIPQRNQATIKPKAHILPPITPVRITQRNQTATKPKAQNQSLISLPPIKSMKVTEAYIDRVLRHSKQPQPKSSYLVIHR